MKKIIIIVLVLLLASCNASKNNNVPNISSNDSQNTENSNVVYTASTLREYNGKDGQPAYIAIEGIVYDVSDEPLWMDGLHQGRFEAGQDLTEEMKNAPHGFSKLNQVKKVGTYED